MINVLLTQGVDLAVQQVAAVSFKNYVKYHWVSGNGAEAPASEKNILLKPKTNTCVDSSSRFQRMTIRSGSL